MKTMTSADRLRWARETKRLSLAEAAAATGMSPKTIQSHETGHRLKRGLSTDYSALYARAYGVSETWLLTGMGDPFGPKGGRELRVQVRGALAAGVWSDSFEWPESCRYDVWLRDEPDLSRETLYAAEVRGNSMNRVYPDGTVVVLRRGIDGIADLMPDKRYHVERTAPDGTVENTLKTVRVRADRSVWLVPDSDDPEFQSAIRVEPGVDVSFVGRVVRAILRE